MDPIKRPKPPIVEVGVGEQCDCGGGKECVCRWTAAAIANAPEVDIDAKPAAHKASYARPEESPSQMHEDPERQPSVYDIAHGRTLLVPPTAQTAIDARKTLLLIVARTREALPLCEHEEGVLELMSLLERLEASAEECAGIASGIITESANRAGAMQ